MTTKPEEGKPCPMCGFCHPATQPLPAPAMTREQRVVELVNDLCDKRRTPEEATAKILEAFAQPLPAPEETTLRTALEDALAYIKHDAGLERCMCSPGHLCMAHNFIAKLERTLKASSPSPLPEETTLRQLLEKLIEINRNAKTEEALGSQICKLAIEASEFLASSPSVAPEETRPIKLNEFQLASIAIWAQDSGPDIGDVWGNEEVRRLNLTAFARKILGDQKASSPSVEPALICRNCGLTKQLYCPDCDMLQLPVKPEPSVEMRERFEDWIERELPGTDLYIRSDGHYGDLLTAYLWKGWQAGAASQGAPHDCKGVLCPKCQTIIMGHGCCDSK